MAVTREEVAAIYVATFNRAPLAEGLDYWTSSDFTIEMVADCFFQQPEAQEIYTNDGVAISNQEFVIRIYDNLFNRLPMTSGLQYWTNALDSGAVSQAQMILAVMNGATGDDATILANKTEVGMYYADQGGAATDFSLGDIDETDESLANGLAAVDAALATAVDVELTAGTDDLTGTSANEYFEAPITQNPWAGGVSNTLSSADAINGGAGTDTLYAELVPEFYGVTGDNTMDVQPDIQSVEYIEFEAMDVSASVNAGATVITVDAKKITDVDHIGSTYSDGDLVIENLTTRTAAGAIRNTEEVTITMDHTDSFDSDGDASDLIVLFDEDYLVSGQTSQASAYYFLLDEDAELNGLAERLNRINVDGIRFTLGDSDTVIELSDPDAQTAMTHEGFVAALQDALEALIDDGTVPEGTTLTLDYSITDVTGLDDGSISNPIPAIVLTTGDGTVVTPVGYSQVEDTLGNYDVYGQFDSESATENNPIAVDVELEKVGRDGEGGNLIIGGKDLDLNTDTDEDQADGITVFNVDVNGNDDQPSNLGNISSTNQALETIYISNGNEWDGAELTIRDGIGIANAGTDGINYNNGAEYELTLIDATAFDGDFSLAMSAYTSQQAVTSLFGSGNDSYDWMSVEADAVSAADRDFSDYYISMGSGNDVVTAALDGDSVDAIDETFTLEAGAGDDDVTLTNNDAAGGGDGVSQRTMIELGQRSDYIEINLGSGDDTLDMDNDFNGYIIAGDGNDFVNMNSGDANGNGNGTAGFITIGNNTAVQNFGERVLYQAQLTISFAGFEATVDIDTTSADDFIADQTTINKAVMEAIDTDPVLSELLTYDLDDGTQQLTITAAHETLDIEGANSIGIAIYQPTLVTANAGDGEVVLSSGDLSAVEAGFIATNNLHNTTNTLVNTLDSDDFVAVDTAVAAIGTLTWAGAVNEFGVGDNAIYTEIETDVELTRGAQTSDILDDAADNYVDYAAIGTDSTTGFNLTTINMGTGTNDIVVMHSNDNNLGVLEIDGTFGKVSVLNWQDTPTHTITNAAQMGFNATDFTALLDSQVDPSGTTNTNSAVDVAVTTNIVAGYEAVTGLSAAVTNTNTAVANSVNIIRFIEDAANSETFENLTASTLVASLNNGGTAYGNIDDNTLDAAIAANGIVIGGTAKHIILVENSTNEGEYKVFYVESDDDATTNANGDFNTSTPLELGIVDFGASVNLMQVGSVAYDSLVENLAAAIDTNAASFTYDADGDGTVSAGEGLTSLTGEVVNTAPVVDDQTLTVDENSVAGTVVGTVAASDADGDALTYLLPPTVTEFAIDSATGVVTVAEGAVLDFETTDSYSIIVRVNDSAGAFDTAALTIALNDVVEGGDTTPPTLDSFTPADDAIDVPVDADLVLNFSEAVQAGTGDIVVFDADGLVEAVSVEGDNAIFDGNTVTVDLLADLAPDTDYFVRVQPKAIEDLAGNAFAGISAVDYFNFTTTTGGGGTETVEVTTGNTLPGYDASAADVTFDFTQGNYTYIIDGFDSGDILDVLDTGGLGVSNASDTDGILELTVADVDSGTTLEITLMGVDLTQDAAIFNVGSFNTAFGTGSFA